MISPAEKLEKEFAEFLREMGFSVSLGDVELEPIPRYLASRYTLFGIRAGGQDFLGMVPNDPPAVTPGTLEKDIPRLIAASNAVAPCVVLADLPAYTRGRLVQARIPFVIPGVQIYWPEMGLVLQEKSRKYRTKAQAESLSPATQAIVIAMILGRLDLPASSKYVSMQVGYSPMTVSRALDELEALDLAEVSKDGRLRVLDNGTENRDLWGAALPFLQSPVSTEDRYLFAENEHLFKAGETALAARSMLAAPEVPQFAVDRGVWKVVGKDFEPCPVAHSNTCRVQVWKYDPALFAKDGVVDPFSLFLSLRDEPDERVEGALDDMMDAFPW